MKPKDSRNFSTNWQKGKRRMHKDELSLNDIITLFSAIGILLSIIMLACIAGGVDCDSLTILDAAKKSIVWSIILVLSFIGVLKVERDEEESEFDNL